MNARWLTRDPAGYDGGINLYAYCDGNPVMGIDPSGLKNCTDMLQKIFDKMKLLQKKIDKYDSVSDGLSHSIFRSIGGRKVFLGKTALEL